MKENITVGSVVKSIQGYDKGNYYVVKSINGYFAYLTNGFKRPLSHPKKKNVKHLQSLNLTCELDKSNELRTNQNVQNLIKSINRRQ